MMFYSTLISSEMLTEVVVRKGLVTDSGTHECGVCLMMRQGALNVFTGVFSPLVFGASSQGYCTGYCNKCGTVVMPGYCRHVVGEGAV